MSERIALTTIKWIGRVMLGTGAGLIIALRVKGCHMTEGEALAEYWHLYALGMLLACMGGLEWAMRDEDHRAGEE